MSLRANLCYRCKQPGHFARECPDVEKFDDKKKFSDSLFAPNRSATRCFRCNTFGHVAKDCSIEQSQSVCYNCNQPGHLSRECSGPRLHKNTTSLSEKSQCFKCLRPGHFARDCGAKSSDEKNNSSNFSAEENH